MDGLNEVTKQTDRKRVLVCGHRSFAAQSLPELLKQQGHEVVCFSRGTVGRENGVVTGPVLALRKNPLLSGSFDTVINYIVLSDESIQNNLDYVEGLLRFCEEHDVKHLIHLSSMSVYKSGAGLITECRGIETNPGKKGSYGALKIATEQYLAENVSARMKLSLLRPAFILDRGLNNPIGGTGIRLPWGSLLTIGNPNGSMPLITREIVNQAIAKIIVEPPSKSTEALLLVNQSSPTRREYLEACCDLIGCGIRVTGFPTALWLTTGVLGEVLVRLVGKPSIQPFVKARSVCRNYKFDTSQSRMRLGMEFSFDWRSTLRTSLGGQELNFRPLTPFSNSHRPALNAVTFIGFGRIVKQRHLPALRNLGFKGQIIAYDLRSDIEKDGIQVKPIESALEPSDLFVIATPGPRHIEALGKLEAVDAPTLIEKPLCYSTSQLDQWLRFAQSRKTPVFVCHNYRFKPNTQQMIRFLSKFNPGRLLNVNVHFESPSVNSEPLVQRNERLSQTLLMDYSIHFLDLACMFESGEWQTSGVRYELNERQQTSLIEGRITSNNYSVSFLLRQGFGLRRAKLLFNFQNYSISLGFFPDTFVAYTSNDNPILHAKEALASGVAILRKLKSKVTGNESDRSHQAVFSLLTETELEDQSLTIHNLAPFYRAMFQIADSVYND